MADQAEAVFEALVNEMSAAHPDVAAGRMMSRSGLTYDAKVFAFFRPGEMVFRLGKGFRPDEFGLEDWRYLAPFKHRPPMKGWFCVPFSDPALWRKLADEALAVMKAERG